VAEIKELSGARRSFSLGLTTDVGRDPGSVIHIVDRLVSRNHAEIRRTPDGRYRIVDLNSTYGTYVDGKKISEHLLRNQDEILLGTTRLRFVTSSDETGASAIDTEPEAPDAAVVQTRLQVASEREQFPPAGEQPNTKRLRQDYEKLRATYAISQEMSLDEGLDGLLEKIIDTAIELLQADRAAILLVDPESGVPVPRIAKNREGESIDIQVSQSILRETISRRVGIISADAGVDARFGAAQSIMISGIRSAMSVPMLHAGELLGALHCDTLLATNAFKESDLDLFTTIANQAAVAVRNATLLQRVQQETSTRVQFQRFFSPGVVDQIISGRMRVGQKGETRPITVFFVDIRGFTRMSEGMDPKDIVELLNDYYEEMVAVLFRHEGTLDKYVGDELMALFGAPGRLPDAPFAAVSCAVEMRDVLRAFNERQAAAGGKTLRVGFGIHSGDALCGIIGSNKTRQYTAMGDTVNTASRLCSIAKADEILISEQTYAEVRDRVRVEELPPATVKGKRKPLKVFNVLGQGGGT
jgi:adenylate cyclase